MGELKRMLGFIVVRGCAILYVQPEELGKEEIVEPVKPRKVKATAKASGAAAATKAGSASQLPAGLMRPGGIPGLAGLNPLLGGKGAGMPRMPMMPGLGGLSGMPGLGSLGCLPGLGFGMGMRSPAWQAWATRSPELVSEAN